MMDPRGMIRTVSSTKRFPSGVSRMLKRGRSTLFIGAHYCHGGPMNLLRFLFLHGLILFLAGPLDDQRPLR